MSIKGEPKIRNEVLSYPSLLVFNGPQKQDLKSSSLVVPSLKIKNLAQN